MYKLIIVDDEQEVRQGIIQKIPFGELGFKCVGEAENGVEALEVIERTNPDLGIIDIKMPYMDGIELAEHIHRKYPAMRLIILSGFDDFEFARQAIKYNVLDYVLKPVSAADIVKLLQDTKSKLDEIKAEKRDVEKLRVHYMESLPIIRERFLNAIVLKRHSVANIEEKLMRYGFDLGQPAYKVVVVKPDDLGEQLDDDLHAFAIYQTIQEIVSDRPMTAFHNHQGETLMIISGVETFDYEQSLEEIRQSAEKINGQTVTIGVGETVTTMTDLNTSYLGARQALNYSVLEGKNKILDINDLEPGRLGKLVYDELTEEALCGAIRGHDDDLIQSVLNQIMTSLSSKDNKLEDVRLYITELLMSLLRLSRSNDIILEWFRDQKDIFTYVSKVEDLTKLHHLLLQLSQSLSKAMAENRRSAIKTLVDEAADHIDKHYPEEISLDQVASLLHVSSEYLSRQFSKERGVNFSTYLTKVRLERARRMIEETDLKNFQVAEKVGYKEPNYFSYAYKKFFGVSPSAYRKSLK